MATAHSPSGKSKSADIQTLNAMIYEAEQVKIGDDSGEWKTLAAWAKEWGFAKYSADRKMKRAVALGLAESQEDWRYYGRNGSRLVRVYRMKL